VPSPVAALGLEFSYQAEPECSVLFVSNMLKSQGERLTEFQDRIRVWEKQAAVAACVARVRAKLARDSGEPFWHCTVRVLY
jgi:hypothetical protein